MKKLLLLTFSFLLLNVNAQTSFIMNPNDSIVQDVNPNEYTAMMIEQQNLSGGMLTLGVEILHNSIPPTWDGMVCVYGVCFGSIPSSGATIQMDPISGTTKAYVRLTVNPLGDLQGGILQVLVFDIYNPIDMDTCTWIVNSVDPPTSVNDNEIKNLSIFPNPASNVITISSSDLFNKVVITDFQGKKIKENTLFETTETSINISKFLSGVYFSKIYSDEKLIGNKKFIVIE